MKILLLSAPFDFYQGGSEYQYTLIDEYMSKRGDDVRYLFRYKGDKPRDKKYITYDYTYRKNYSRYCVTDARKIYSLIAEFDPEIVYKRGINYISAIGMKYCHWNKKSYIQHIASSRDVEKYTISGGLKKRIKTYADAIIEKYVISGSTCIIAQAHYQDDLMYRHYRRNADFVLPNIAPLPERPVCKLEEKQVVWVGNFKPVKRPELFIQLAEELQNSGAKFIMVGRDPQNSWSRDLIRRINGIGSLSYIGERSLGEVNALLSGSHIFVNTSEYEGFPNTYIQAFMRGVPVITLKIDPDDIIKNHNLGYHSGSLAQLKIDLLRLLNDDQLREQMGQATKQYSYTNHGLDNLDKFYGVIETLK